MFPKIPKNYFPKCFTILVSTLSVLSLSILTVNAQKKSENQKTQVITSQISFESPISLESSLEKATQFLGKNSEVTVSLNGQIELEKLSLPMSLQVQSGDSAIKLAQKWQESKKAQLQSLLQLKQKEVEFLSTPIWNHTNTDNLLGQATILANINQDELENELKIETIENQKTNQILVQSISISRTNLEFETDVTLDKIAKENKITEEKIDLTTATKDDQRDSILKPKTKLNSNAKIAKKYLQKSESNLQSSNQSSSKDREPKTNFYSESNKSEVKSSSSNFSIPQSYNSVNNSEQKIDSQNSISANLSTSSPNQNPKIPTLQDIIAIENVENNNAKEVEISPNLIQKSKSKQKIDEGSNKNSKIAKIQTFTYRNSFYVSQEDEQKRKNEIEFEKNKALEHNKKHKQNYIWDQYKQMLKAGTAPDPAIYQFSVEKNGQEISQNEIKNLQDEVKNAWIGPVLGSIKTEARGLNNSVVPLLIYSWDNSGLSFDVPSGNNSNGTQLGLWYTNYSNNQQFTFNNSTNTIQIRGKCLEVASSNFTGGARVQLWDCNGTDAQNWIFSGTSLRPMSNQNLCLEPQGGLVPNGGSILWYCNGTSPQRWVAGRNDFSSNFSVDIHASKTKIISVNPNPGHVLLSYKVDNNLVNTQSAWPGYDMDCSTNNGNVNNICDNDAAYVDKIEDWDYVRYNDPAFKIKSSYISKRLSDVYRYNSGYRWGLANNGLNNVNYFFWPDQNNVNTNNCATFSVRIWNNIMGDLGYSILYVPRPYLPSDVWAVI